MASAPAQIIKAQKLTPETYSAYGDVIAAIDDRPFKPANFGTAKQPTVSRNHAFNSVEWDLLQEPVGCEFFSRQTSSPLLERIA